MIKYSEVKEKLKIEIKKPDQTELAHLTHYFQTYQNGVSHYFQKSAIEYGKSIDPSVVNEPHFQGYLPFEWDIPFPPHEHGTFKFIDLFAGIGGFRMAFHNLGGKCVFTSEWNQYAQKTYHCNFGEVPFGDITKIDEKEIPEHDILIAGFPCQPFSIAGVSKKNSLGKAHGFKDETQGTLFFDIKRILKEKRPKSFLLENVKNLVSHDKGNTFKVIQKNLRNLGVTLKGRAIRFKSSLRCGLFTPIPHATLVAN